MSPIPQFTPPNGPLIIEGNPSPGFATLAGIDNSRGIYGMIQDLK